MDAIQYIRENPQIALFSFVFLFSIIGIPLLKFFGFGRRRLP
jgi:NADH:ubiquinone oxidoreductase subunit 2 (subunit N)